MKESFVPVPATFYPVAQDGTVVNLPVSRSDLTGRLVAVDANANATYDVEDEGSLIRLG